MSAKAAYKNPKTITDAATSRQGARSPKPSYVMVGGFLGAGKTTAIAKMARYLTDRGRRVGLITNDQASGLVDTAMLAARGFSVQEIAGGCFCCRFNSLTDAAQKLAAQTRPDVFIAEPVGSCTDLVATVAYPLRRLYGDDFSIAPFSVMVDPIRALRVFGLEPGSTFSEKVRYIYRKQLEEANVIVLNKCDLVDRERLARIHERLASEFTNARIFELSARSGAGLEPWFEHIFSEQQVSRPAMAVDYQQYAEGEALLGWLNATVQLSSSTAFDGNAALRRFAGSMHRRLNAAGCEIAHLKMTLDPDTGLGDLAVVNLVRNDYVPELSQELSEPVLDGGLIVNLRAEAEPAALERCLTEGLNDFVGPDPRMIATVEHCECFRPGRPVPVHRFENAG